MFELLTDRLKPPKYPEKYILDRTTVKFINQSTALVFDFLRSMRADGEEINNLTDSIYRGFLYHTGKRPAHPEDWYFIEDLFDLFNQVEDEAFLDLLDLTNQFLHREYQDYDEYLSYVDGLNKTLKRNGIGFWLVDGRFIPLFDQKMSEEVTMPAFTILSQYGFDVAHEELMRAYDSYKTGDNISSIISATKSFESVVNSILERKNIAFNKSDKTINKMKKLFEYGSYPKYLESSVSSLITLLNAAGNVRNNDAAHAQTTKTEINDALVKFVLDSVASSILFMVRSFSE